MLKFGLFCGECQEVEPDKDIPMLCFVSKRGLEIQCPVHKTSKQWSCIELERFIHLLPEVLTAVKVEKNGQEAVASPSP